MQATQGEGSRHRRALVAWGVGVALALALPARADQAVRISGTGSGVGGMQLLADAFMRANPGTRIEVLPALGSAGGISALIAGKIELAVSNRVPNGKELAEDATLKSAEYARTPFVVAVHRDLGVSALSGAALAALFADGPATYPNGKRARPVMRLNDSTDTNLLKTFAPELPTAIEAATARRGMLSANTDSEAADMVEKVPGAFATSTLAQIASERRPFVAVAIDGKEPSTANLQSGRYPHFKSLHLVTNAKSGTMAQRFIDFIGSPAGRKLLSANGHLPL